jgi:uncharacterized protein (TIGR03435 family)
MPLRNNARPLFFCILLLASVTASAQSEQSVKPMAKEAHPSFEVATIKPHDPSANDDQGFNHSGGHFSIRNEPLVPILMVAYSIYRSQIDGLPGWKNDRWDIEGIADTPGDPNQRQQQEMLQKLLVDRFGLKVHRERRELPVYFMQIAKGGPKLKPAAKPDDGTGQHFRGEGNVAILEYTSTNMSDFVLGESFVLDRPLVDHTGLTGKYDFTLRYNFRETAAGGDSTAVPGLFTAVQEQLGLKFVPTKASAEVLVIDHIDRPSAN